MDREGGQEVGTTQFQSKKGHMLNIYLTDADQEAIVDFVEDHQELYNKTSEHFRTRPGRIAYGKSLQAAASCQWRCARLGLNHKGLATETHPVHVWSGPNEITENQNCIQDKFSFLKNHIKRKGLSKYIKLDTGRRERTINHGTYISFELQCHFHNC